MTEAKEWHAAVGGQSVGPMTKLELGSGFRSGEYSQETLIFKQGMSGWVAASQIAELSDILSGRGGAGVPPAALPTESGRRAHEVNYDIVGSEMPWCTTPIEADSSLGPDSHHPIISLSGIPSAVMVFRILYPILASTLCAANPLARIAEPTIAL